MAFSPNMALFVIPYRKVTADSGWDTDYSSSWDSGSSWSSSSWDHDYSSSGSYSGEPLPAWFSITFTIVWFIIFGTITFFAIKCERGSRSKVISLNLLTDEQVHNLDPTIDIDKFKNMVYNSFVNVQNAWMNFDYESLRKLLTDELYNTYNMQLNALSVKGQKNVMEDFILNNFAFINIQKTNNIQSVEVLLTVSFRDYVVDNLGNVVRGNKNRVYKNTYRLTYIKTINSHINYCGNCGAKLEQTSSSVCPYCKSTIVSSSYNYVMSKKVKINQE